MAKRERSLEIAIKARDEYSRTLKTAEGDLKKFADAQNSAALNRKSQMDAIRGIQEQRKAYREATTDVRNFKREMSGMSESSLASSEDAEHFARLGHSIDIAKDKAKKSKAELAAYREELHRLRGITQGSIKDAVRHADAMEVEGAAARRAAQEQQALASATGILEGQLQGATSGANAFAAAQAKMGASGNAHKDALRSVTAAKIEYREAQERAQAYGQALAAAAQKGGLAATEQARLNGEFQKARDVVRQTKAALTDKQAALQSLRNATRQQTVAEQASAQATETTTVKLRRVGGAADSVENQQRRLSNAIRGTNADMRKQAQVAADTARDGLKQYEASLEGARNANSGGGGWAGRITGAWGTQQGRGPLGLRPYEITNLSYQINDVVSGLAMGQAPMQIFAQQAGQIIQIFPKMAMAILRMAPALVVLAPFAIALGRISAEASRLASIQRGLDLLANGASYSAKSLKDTADALDATGTSFKNAQAAISAFTSERIDSSLIDSLAKAALVMSQLTGESLEDTADKIAGAFADGADGVRELDAEMGFLTASQYETIRALEAAGDKTGALQVAASALEAQMVSIKGETHGWALALREVAETYDMLMGKLANTKMLQAVAASWDELGNAIGGAIGRLNNDFTPIDLPEVKIDVTMSDDELAAQIAKMEDAFKASELLGFFAPLLDGLNMGYSEMYDHQEATLAALNEEKRRREAIGQETNNQAKLGQDIEDIVGETVKELGKQVELEKLTSREREIQEALDEAREEAQKRAVELGMQFLGLTKEQTAAIREQAGALWDLQNPMKAGQFESSYTSDRFSGGSKAEQQAELVAATADVARQLGVEQKDLLTAMSYETGGTFDPWQKGPTTQHGQHRGLIQWGEPQREKYGVTQATSITDQVKAAGKYLVDAGVKSGDGLLQIYAAINAGNASKIHATDENNGGAPGTVLDKVSDQMEGHEARAEGLIAAYASVVETSDDAADTAEDAAKAATKAKERADKYRLTREENLALAEFELSLDGKTAEEKAVALAIEQAKLEAKRAGVTLTAEELSREGDIAREKYRQNQLDKDTDKSRKEALKQAKLLEQEITRLKERQKFLTEERDLAASRGDSGTVAQIDEALVGVNTELDAAIQKALAFWEALGGEGSAAAIQKLQQLQGELKRTGAKVGVTAEQMTQLLVGAIGNGLSKFAEAIGNGESATDALGAAFRQMASDILIQLGQMIMQQALFNAIGGGSPTGAGGIGGGLAGLINGLFFHTGGKVGAPGQGTSRAVPASAFASAVRYHDGGIAGLKPNEVASVLEKGEEVLTEDNPRHIDNIGGGGAAANNKRPLTIVNAIDSPEVLSSALGSAAGSEIMMNFFRNNREEIKAEIE